MSDQKVVDAETMAKIKLISTKTNKFADELFRDGASQVKVCATFNGVTTSISLTIDDEEGEEE